MTPYVGQIYSFGFNFPPAIGGFVPCDGRLLPITNNEALFTLIGTTYGGNGSTNFAVPDLRGRVPIHMGQGPGLANYVLGQASGQEAVTITSNQMPSHTHGTTQMGICVNSLTANSNTPVNNYLAVSTDQQQYVNTPVSDPYQGFATTPLTTQGASLPLEILEPFLAINYCIATQGLFPVKQ